MAKIRKTEQITLRLTENQLKKLDAWVEAKNQSRADLIGEMLEALPNPGTAEVSADELMGLIRFIKKEN